MTWLDRQIRKRYGYRGQHPPTLVPLPGWLEIPRPDAVDAAVRLLMIRPRAKRPYIRSVAIVAEGPPGAHGFGLAVVARMVCADQRVRRRFGEQIWWVTAGPETRDKPGTAAARHQRNVRLAGKSMSFDGELWSAAEDRVLDMYRCLLLVVDAVPADAEYKGGLLSGRPGHVHLVTTMDRAGIPSRADAVAVDAVTIERAVRDALRTRAGRLPAGGAERLAELGIFAEGTKIPVELVRMLWRSTAAMGPDDSAALCRRLAELSLLHLHPDATVAVDPVVRSIGRLDLGEGRLTELNAALVDDLAGRLPQAGPLAGSVPDRAWWRLADPEGYLCRHLVSHLLDAGRQTRAGLLAGDLRWVTQRLVRGGLVAPFRDLTLVAQATSTTAPTSANRAVELRAGLAENGPLLDPTVPPEAVLDILLYRLHHHPGWGGQARALQATMDRPILVNLPPDHPLAGPPPGSGASAWDVDLSLDGSLLAVTSGGSTVTCLDLGTGRRRHLECSRRESAGRVEFSPDGSWLAVRTTHATGGWGVEDPPASTYVYVFDVRTGNRRFTLTGGYARQILSFAVGLDSSWLFTHAEDGDRAWDARTGQQLVTVPASGMRPPRDSLRTETTSPDGAWRARVHENELRLEDVAHDRPGPMMRLGPSRHDRVNGTLWLPGEGNLLAYGLTGLHFFQVRRPAGPVTGRDRGR
ncbi:hypothetical protein I0C86_34290 [Plantactinospora sp. S1510]|uniref:Uncharacterized protein n=1 Tax=Plantactinospora alkalitolerans TaxID=2789879 RepID=A0ABS0H680_9ACTN|nr:hypothetical protein [Plantactinospora alkalitolerans]MBF9133970.1 hypothetical protein [Plantactinospora alkalitolerans]